ncbi:hypothetical protein AZL_d03810 (plasmid) [Azospirillum sp. B510]|uniref:hypothetical protein n=1 Tax=Azospirillum sp. (strain B510) TaxID=137722 RepID=UPI0001C4C90C|nr:hypothetical protein [Azospirillum sp. B510]BAI76207.1 hypothetical protein AZL_d03810 [Azospirillum sp. B510]
MSKYRWLRAEWPISIRVLAHKIQGNLFTQDSRQGFVIDRVRENYIEARYIERISYTDVIIDPFGSELSFPKVEFRQSQFRASSQSPGLELINPPRSVAALMNRLSEVADFGLAISSIGVDVTAWAELLQAEAFTDATIRSLQIGALNIETGVSARAVITGNHDVRSACQALVQDRSFVVEKIQLDIFAPQRCAVILANNASAKIATNDQADAIVEALRVALEKTFTSTPPRPVSAKRSRL